MVVMVLFELILTYVHVTVVMTALVVFVALCGCITVLKIADGLLRLGHFLLMLLRRDIHD